MTAEDKHRAAVALLSCLATPDIGELVQEINDAELRRQYAIFLRTLSDVRDHHKVEL